MVIFCFNYVQYPKQASQHFLSRLHDVWSALQQNNKHIDTVALFTTFSY